MAVLKIELFLSLVHLALCTAGVLGQEALPHLAEQPTCVALDAAIAVSHVLFACHKLFRSGRGRNEGLDGRP